jgi:N4-gp56 family major capsid protein
MATHVYGNGTNSTSGTNTITHFYDKAGIKAANRVETYGQFASRKSMPKKMGKTYKISKFLHMYDRSINDSDFAGKGYLSGRDLESVQTLLSATDGTGVSLTEGAGATNERILQKVTVEATLARYGEMITYVDEVELFSEDAMQVRYREELGEAANSRYEDLVQLDMLATSTINYAGTATSNDTLGEDTAADGSTDDEWKVSYDLIRRGVRRLVRNRAKKNTQVVTGSTKIDTKTIAPAYYAIIDADVKSDL